MRMRTLTLLVRTQRCNVKLIHYQWLLLLFNRCWASEVLMSIPPRTNQARNVLSSLIWMTRISPRLPLVILRRVPEYVLLAIPHLLGKRISLHTTLNWCIIPIISPNLEIILKHNILPNWTPWNDKHQSLIVAYIKILHNWSLWFIMVNVGIIHWRAYWLW
jgi:hypothetical protein